jgi:hypothetical protein
MHVVVHDMASTDARLLGVRQEGNIGLGTLWLHASQRSEIADTGKERVVAPPLSVTDCNRNRPGLQSARFRDHILCLYHPTRDHILCL